MGYRCMCMQSMNLIQPSMWSGGVLTDNANQPKRNIATN